MKWSSATGDPAVYWFFYIFLVVVLTFCGRGISTHGEKYYRRYAWFAIIVYALIEGCRWLRGADYWNYYQELETDLGVTVHDKPEFLYEQWVHFFNLFNLPPTVGFIIYSGLLIGSFVLLFKKYPAASTWAMPIMFLFFGASSAENIVRQYIAISFLMLACYFYFCDQKKWMYICLICCPLFHMSVLYGVILFLFFTFERWPRIGHIPLKWPMFFVGIYLFAYFFWKPEWLQGFADYLSTVNIGEENKMQEYLNNSDRWFTEEGSIANVLGTGVRNLSLVSIVVMFVSNLIIVYGGYKACELDKKLWMIYYFGFIGLIIKTICGDIEILSRFSLMTNWTIPFIIGLILSDNRIRANRKMYYVVCSVFAIRFIFYGIIRAYGSIPYAGCGFIWDK